MSLTIGATAARSWRAQIRKWRDGARIVQGLGESRTDGPEAAAPNQFEPCEPANPAVPPGSRGKIRRAGDADLLVCLRHSAFCSGDVGVAATVQKESNRSAGRLVVKRRCVRLNCAAASNQNRNGMFKLCSLHGDIRACTRVVSNWVCACATSASGLRLL